jgi:hypothetical protein
MRQSGLRITTIVIVRPASHLSMSCEKNADRTALISACVRLCSTTKSSPESAIRRAIPAVAQRAVFLKRFWLMLDQRPAWRAILPPRLQDWRRIAITLSSKACRRSFARNSREITCFRRLTLRQSFSKKSVDWRPTRSTRKWSRTAHPATRNISGPAQPKFLYKSSGADTASAQRSRRRKCAS